MSRDATTVHVLGLAPVPIGHRVEIRWYREMVATPLGGRQVREEPQQPWIKDLDDGVIYAAHWLFHQGGVFSDRVNVGSRDVRSSLELTHSLVGRVLSTQVVTVNTSDQTIETMLVIAPDQSGAAYR